MEVTRNIDEHFDNFGRKRGAVLAFEARVIETFSGSSEEKSVLTFVLDRASEEFRMLVENLTPAVSHVGASRNKFCPVRRSPAV